MKLSRRSKFMILYTIFIVIGLVYILFIADDKMFKGTTNNTSNSIKEEYPTLEQQKKNLVKGSFDYHYDLNYNGKTYKCSGTKKESKNEGTCTIGKKTIEYNEENIEEKLKDLDTNYLNLDYIMKQIKDVEPKLTTMSVKRYYTYSVNIGQLKGDIILYTDNKKITQITIANGNLVYVLYFDYEK